MELFTNVKELALLSFKDADVAVIAMKDHFSRLQAVDAVIGTGKAEWAALWSEAYPFACVPMFGAFGAGVCCVWCWGLGVIACRIRFRRAACAVL
eukprot:9382134-Lingulodinium_polyedra.AAC.1